MTGRTSVDLRLAFMSDFHADDEEDIDRALAMIDDALVPDLGVDHVIIGGDIVDRAQQDLLQRFANGLKRRKGKDRMPVIVPGNHDVYPVSKRDIGSSIIDYVGGVLGPTPTERYEEFCRLFAGGRGKRGSVRLIPGCDYPFGRVLGENVVIAALDSTRNGTLDPREWAAGELREEEIAAVARFFESNAFARHRLIVMHHSPWTEYSESENRNFPMGMAEPSWDVAVKWLAGTGASLVLSGHWHCRDSVELRKKLTWRMRGFRAGVSGEANEDGSEVAYHVIDLRGDGSYRVAERAFDLEELR